MALSILWIGTVITCVISYFTNVAFGLNSIPGIPLFAVGVVSALWPSLRFFKLHPALLALLLCFVSLSFLMSFFSRFIPNMAHVICRLCSCSDYYSGFLKVATGRQDTCAILADNF